MRRLTVRLRAGLVQSPWVFACGPIPPRDRVPAMRSKRFPAVWSTALALFLLTGIAPWLHGPWAAGRFPALCLAPGAALLLWFAREVWRHPARALAACILGSA